MKATWIGILSLVLGAKTSVKSPKKVPLLRPEPRIVGGYEVNPAFQYPFLVSLQRFQQHFCGGTLYSENYVITAAHCTVGVVNFGFDAVVHRHNLELSDAAEKATRRRVINRTKHPEYDQEVVKNDIAVWKLEPIKNRTSYYKSSIVLDDGRVPKNGYLLARVAGWGTTSSGGVASKKLLEVKIPFFKTDSCEKIYTELGGYLDPVKQVCAGYPEGGKDACQGDSGGPLFVKKGRSFILVGIVSWGLGCALPDLPGIYTRVEAYQDWIKKNMN